MGHILLLHGSSVALVALQPAQIVLDFTDDYVSPLPQVFKPVDYDTFCCNRQFPRRL